MGKGSGGEQIQRVIRELPEEAKPFLYGFGDKFIEDPDTGEMVENQDYIQGLLPRSQELFTGEMPEYEVAGFSPMQEQAFALAQEGIGAYKPFLERGDKALGTGIQTVEDAINASKALADQISGQTDRGQTELRQAARDVQAAGDRGEAAGLRGESVAQRAARELRDVTAMARPFQEEGLASIRQGREFLGGAAQRYDPMSPRVL